ncbi:MAG: bifunctional folylpolyglutamate synthase/dihydrofolate synthase [Myxococcales bacterium]|nr:bifunctional folylpolyglutamate synthase/dihydrofolate synthase [Myxococcales bacterium]MCB9733689.1 bifunctional folylpolyglutamate synthase/dihydrofolate synthase [Deltaproteobacteria bacterium]
MTIGSQTGPRGRQHEHEAWRWLDSLHPRGIQLGLDRVREVLDRLGNPHQRLKAVTIAGTNGKGSTAAFVAAMAHAAGYRVGLYTSPHLASVTERIRVAGARIHTDELAAGALRLREVVEGHDGAPPIPLTYFEALTVIALCYFDARDVDLAVLEVGLGGRLDATSVVDPLVALVTPIGLDHMAILGDTLEAICREKAGIIKPGSTLVTNVDPDLFRSVLGPVALANRAPIRRLGVDFLYQWLPEGFRYRGWIHRVGPVRLGLRGVHQGINAAAACAAIEALGSHGFAFKATDLADGLLRARHPGRLERREPAVDAHGERWPAMLLDAAHNPMGAHVLARHVAAFLPERPRIMVFGVNPDKDVDTMLSELAPHVDGIVLTQAVHNPVQAWEPLVAAAARYHDSVTFAPDAREALTLGRHYATEDGGVVVCGSIYVLGEVWPTLPAPTV